MRRRPGLRSLRPVRRSARPVDEPARVRHRARSTRRDRGRRRPRRSRRGGRRGGRRDFASRRVATIAAKEDERIGSAVACALNRVGPEGVVTLEEAQTPGIEVEFVEGMHVDNGQFSPYLIQDTERMETVFENPYVLLTNRPITHVRDLMPTLDAVMKEPRPLVIFAEKVEGAALGLVVQNNQHGTLQAVAVRAPGFGHRRIAHLQDLAAFTGGEVVTDEAGLTLDQVRPSTFGSARRIVISGDSTVLVEGAGSAERVAARLAQIRIELERATHDTDTEVLRERLARLSSRLAVIHVGAATGPELKEKFRRTEGALAATRAAVSEANALTGEFVDLFEDGVIDPLRVTRLTIQHAASVAALMLTTEALVEGRGVSEPPVRQLFGRLRRPRAQVA